MTESWLTEALEKNAHLVPMARYLFTGTEEDWNNLDDFAKFTWYAYAERMVKETRLNDTN